MHIILALALLLASSSSNLDETYSEENCITKLEPYSEIIYQDEENPYIKIQSVGLCIKFMNVTYV